MRRIPLTAAARAAFLAAVVAPFAGAQVSNTGLNHWTPAAAMSAPRSQACSAILQDGSILVVGGIGNSGPVNTAEIYGAGGTFTVAPPMSQARAGAACAALLDGRILVVGGDDGAGALSTAEIFDPASQTWKTTGSLAVAREGHQVVVNGWGSVWVAGGTNASGIVGALEEFEPPLGTFRTVGTLNTPRNAFAMAALPRRQVMIAGGTDGSSTLSSVEIYDGVMGSTSVAGSMAQPRQNFAAAALPDGTAFIAGGMDLNGNLLSSTEIFDPVQGVSTAGPNLLAPRANHFAYALPNNGAVMIAGGTGSAGILSSTETYAPWTGAMQQSAPMNSSRRDQVSTVFRPGNLLVAGGRNETGPLSSSELFQYVTIGTDQPDYAPGTPVKISGAGWQPGEQVSVQVTAFPLDQHHIEFTGSAIADGAGNVTIAGFQVDQSHLGVKFILSASGSRFQAQTSFTDGLNPSFNFTFTPPSGSGAAPGSSVQVLVTVIGSGPVPTGQIIPCLGSICSVALTTPVGALCDPVTGTTYTLQTGASSSTCTFTINSIPAGNSSVGVEYAGDANYNFQTPSANNITYAAAQAATTTTMSSGPSGNQPFGTAAPYLATVTTNGSFAITGTVQFLVNGANSGSPVNVAAVNATTYTASFVPNPPLAVSGTPYLITALFNGDVNNASSTSGNSISTTIIAAATTTTEVFSANPIVYGQPLTVSGTVTAAAGPTPTGTVTVNGLLGCAGVALTAGAYSCVITPAPVPGTYPVTVTYNPGAGYSASTSTSANVVVNTANTQVTAPTVTAAAGTTFTFSATVTTQAPSTALVNSGSFIFYALAGFDANTAACATGTNISGFVPIAVNASGTASSGSVILGNANYTICAVYTPAGGNFNASISPGQNVTSPNVQIGDSVSVPTGGPAAFGQNVTITATVTAASGINPPTGTLTFFDASNGNAQIGTPQTITQIGGSAAATASVTVSNLAAGPHSITATYTTNNGNFVSPTTSAPGSIVIGKTAASFTVSSGAPNNITAGSSVGAASPATFIATYTGGLTLPPTGTITFTTVNGTVCGPVALSTAAGVTSATCNGIAGSPALPAGPASVGLTYSPDSNYTQGAVTPFSFTIVKATSATLLAVTPNSASVGQSVTLTATVSVPGTALVPTGTVTFTLGGNPPLANTCTGAKALSGTVPYTATCTFELTGPGGVQGTPAPISYSAVYSGDVSTLTSTGNITLTAVGGVTSSTLGAVIGGVLSASETLGNTVTLTATAGGLIAGIPATGDFTFTLGGAAANSTCGSPIAVNGSSQASCSFTFAGPVGSAVNYTAVYAHDPNYLTSTVTTALTTLNANPGVPIVTVTPAPVFGQILNINVVVPGTGLPTPVTPTGTVTFTGSGVNVTLPLVNGAVTLSTGANLPSLAPGSYNFTVTYNGDGNYLPSANTAAFIVVKANTTTTVTFGNNSVTVTAIPTAPGSGTPTGTVSIYSGSSATGTPVSTGSLVNGSFTASLSTAQSYVAVYPGDANFNGSMSPAASLARTPTSSTVTLSVSSNPAPANQPVVVTATVVVIGSSSGPTGTVTFTDNGVAIGSASAQGGIASISVTLAAGNHNIVATYSGDSVYPSASASYGLMASKPPSTVTVSSSATATVFGQAITLTARITSSTQSGAPAPTGTVQFFAGSTLLGTANVAGGVATLTVPNLPAGVTNLIVVYSGDANYGSFSGNAGSVTVGKAQAAATLTANTNNGRETLTATVAVVAPGGGTPTGTIQFIDTVTGKVVGTATLAGGTASITVPVTTDPIQAVYSGDGNFGASTAANVAAISAVNAASYIINYAADEIVTVFGAALATQTASGTLPLQTTLGGISVTVTDSAGAMRSAVLFYVSLTQISFLIPAGTANGTATIAVTTASGTFTNTITVTTSGPGLFTANASGTGPLSAQVVSVAPGGAQTYTNTASLSGQTFINAPISLTPAANTFYLLLYGTGIRHGAVVTVTINGTTYTPTFAGAQGTFVGLDQINILLPASLAGSGPVNVSLTVDGQVSNAGTISFQ